MKKKVLLLVALSSVMHLVCAKNEKLQKVDVVKHVALNKELKRSKATKCCGGSVSSSDSLCCKRGKTGKKGSRGDVGATGPSFGGGVGEFFINAVMMFVGGSPEDIFVYFPRSLIMYSNSVFPMVPVWETDVDGTAIGMNFNVPDDLDNTKPVTAVIHVLIYDYNSVPLGNVQYQVQLDYQPNNGVTNATFVDTENSGNVLITPPSSPLSTPYAQFTIPVSLDNTLLVPGDWAFMSIGRISATTNEYTGFIALSTVSVQYSRLAS